MLNIYLLKKHIWKHNQAVDIKLMRSNFVFHRCKKRCNKTGERTKNINYALLSIQKRSKKISLWEL
jgi:hypothetical protein